MNLNIVRGVLETNKNITIGEFMDLHNSGVEMDMFAVVKENESTYAEDLVESLK